MKSSVDFRLMYCTFWCDLFGLAALRDFVGAVGSGESCDFVFS